MLMGLALTAFQPEMDAQSRGNSRSSGSTYSRSSNSSNRQAVKPSSSASKQSNSVRKPSGSTAARPTAQPSKPSARPQSKPETPSARPESRPKPDISPADRNPARPSGNKPSGNKPNKPSGNKPNKPSVNKPVGVRPPASRPPQPNRPPAYRPAPPRPKPRPAVRPIIVRPSYGTVIAANIAADLAWSAVRLSYYNTVANTYSQISENNQYIAEQNAIIAQNNATIAAQNQIIAQTHTKAQAAYSLANELGLVQSYAAAGSSYFYQDGVFYSQAADGQYYVIVPPAGALVETLPEDFDIVILNGKEYYRVDDTVYQMTISEGKPYFEVLGQMN